MKRPSWLLSLLLFAITASPLLAQTEAPPETAPAYIEAKEYAPLWVGDTATVTPADVQATIAGIKAQQADPEQIVVFIHGFDVPRDSSTEKFDALAVLLKHEFAKTNTRAAFAGIQWHSAAETSIINMAGAYFGKIPLARSVGRGPARELLLGIQEAFPRARVSVMAHSMGCEVAAAAVVPEMVYTDNANPFVETFQVDDVVKLHMAVLCGSDLDYDVWAKGQVVARSEGDRCRLIWSSVAPYMGKGDKAMNVRARVRGTGGGAAFPKMSLQQLDAMLTSRRIILDGESIPKSHNFNEYYDQARLQRIVPTMVYLANPQGAKPADLAEVDAILAAPDDAAALAPYLDSGHYGTMYYTLWRLERVNCGDARHMTDGTIEGVARMIKDKPKMIWREGAKSECLTLKKGQFPSETMMTRAGAPPRSKKN